MPEAPCEHVGSIIELGHPPQRFCEVCLAELDDGLTLRVCLACGHVGCAEGSASNHAAQHYAETDHPIAVTVGADRPSRWCYPDGRAV